MTDYVNIAYLARLDLSASHLLGVAKKIDGQVSVLKKAFGTVDLYSLQAGKVLKNDSVLKDYGNGNLIKRLTYYFVFYTYLARLTLDIDFLYIRYQRSSPVFLYMLSRLKAKNPKLIVFVEIPSYPYGKEDSTLRGNVLGFIDKLSRPFMHRYVDRIVTFSKQEELFGIPTIRTENGVDLKFLTPHEAPIEKSSIRLISVANLAYWHGYDRVLQGLFNYYSNKAERKVFFDIVGTGAELNRLKSDVKKYNLEEYVKFLGPLHGKELDDAFSSSHIAISTLGVHRVQHDTSNLKSREYCGRGIPFVTACKDNDFPQELDFIFNVPEDDQPLSIGELINFYDGLAAQSVGLSQRMREYTSKHLTWHSKLTPVIDQLKALTSKKGNL